MLKMLAIKMMTLEMETMTMVIEMVKHGVCFIFQRL